ncbi:type II toxin-antitoxin system HicA family toxin [Methanoplanus limicola]|uniref:YcfA family protein n=1 Tax=Methanoplanus limicola DSM 2279 TaxID=937775 RepID=H1Z083_9EURY|nr:type II toxin-antitoxin system HicA family toxin [Methanoplanus limicola]EHQ36175.1 YcfA family protein [Methanoplanus limicola DSM 2279]
MLPTLKSRELIKFLEYLGFNIIRQKGSHIRLKSDDGRFTTVPFHSNQDIPKGLIRKIIREDLEMTYEEFNEHFARFSKIK